MRTNGGDGQGSNSGGEGSGETSRTYTDEERRMFAEKLNAMDHVEFSAFIRDVTVDRVRDVFIIPLMDALVAERKNLEVILTSFKYEDFWEYRELMIEISNKNPGLAAEQVYRLAKNECLLRGN